MEAIQRAGRDSSRVRRCNCRRNLERKSRWRNYRRGNFGSSIEFSSGSRFSRRFCLGRLLQYSVDQPHCRYRTSCVSLARNEGRERDEEREREEGEIERERELTHEEKREKSSQVGSEAMAGSNRKDMNDDFVGWIGQAGN